MATRYWLMKSDPDTFGLPHLERSPRQTTCWDGVRNYQARNLLRDEIRKGDGVLFYHSQVQPPAVVALARGIGVELAAGELHAWERTLAATTFEASQSMVTGVPTFMLGEWAFGGIQEESKELERLLEKERVIDAEIKQEIEKYKPRQK